jgi:D-aspartate ligase
MTVSAVVYPDNLAALGVCRALGRRGGPVTVLGPDHTAPARYSRYARAVTCPPREPLDAFVDFLTGLGKAQARRAVLFLTDDASLLALAPYRERLDECYRLTTPPVPLLHDVLRKDRLYAAVAAEVPVPRTRLVQSEADLESADGPPFPAVLKPVFRWQPPRDGHERPPFDKVFGAKARRARDAGELRAAWRAARARGFEDILVQEEIPGPVSALYGVGLYAVAGRVVAAFTSQKLEQTPPDFGDGLVVRAADTPGLTALAQATVARLGFHGMADLEFKRDVRDGRLKLLDMNPRPWLWINLATACGVDLPWAAYLDALGRPLEPAAFAQRDWSTRWLSLRGLMVAAAHGLAGGHPAGVLRAFARQARGPRVGPLWSRDDVLLGMVASPRYWRDTLAHTVRALRALRAVKQEA